MGRSNITHDLLRPMSIGDILDGAIKLYRSNFLLLIGIGAWVYIPLCLLGLVISQGIFSLLTQFVSIFLAAVVTVAISERILDREISITDSYRRTSKRLASFIGAMLLVALIGVSLLIAAGLFIAILSPLLGSLSFPLTSLAFTVMIGFLTVAIMVWLLFIPQAVLLEGNKATKSLGRNMNLVKGSFWKAYAIMLLVFIAMFMVNSLVWLVGGAVLTIFGGETGTAQNFVQDLSMAVNKIRQFPLVVGIVNLLLQPFRMVVITLLYYDIRVRKEGYDLEVMAKELAIEAPAGYEFEGARSAQSEQEYAESDPEEIQGRRIDQYQKEMLRQKILEQQGSSLSDGQQSSKTVQSNEARLSLILGFCSVGCELIVPFFLFLGLWLPAIAIVFGVKGLRTINRKGGVLEFTGKGLAIWGILLGVFSYMLLLLNLAGLLR